MTLSTDLQSCALEIRPLHCLLGSTLSAAELDPAVSAVPMGDAELVKLHSSGVVEREDVPVTLPAAGPALLGMLCSDPISLLQLRLLSAHTGSTKVGTLEHHTSLLHSGRPTRSQE